MKVLQSIRYLTIIAAIGSLFMVSCMSEQVELKERITQGEAQLFSDSTGKLDQEIANGVLRDYIEYADTYKSDTMSANYLFKAGDLANGLNRPVEAISIYDRLQDQFPDNKKAAAALFMQAFIYETVMQNKDMAKERYKLFLVKYPDHRLAGSAKASVDQLDANLSDEDLIKMFEEQQKKKENK